MSADDFDDFEPEPPPSLADRRVFALGDHVEIGRALVTELRGIADVVFDEGRPWTYTPSGRWEAIDRAHESRIVQGFAGSPKLPNNSPLRIKASDVSGAIALAHDQIAKPGFFLGAPPGLVFSNGFVKVSARGVEILEHSAEHRARTGYPFEYVGNVCAKRWLAFLYSVFRDDDDREEKIVCLQEFLGACLLGVAPIYQRYVVTIGRGGEGKSTLTQIAVSAMPQGTTCAIAPQEWGNEYRRALLIGKRLNAVAELPEADIIASESVKAIITGDSIVGREIRQAPITFSPIAGHMFAANKLPGTNDQSDGFWRRILVLTFNRSFANDAECNPRIATEIIEAELPAVVSWMLQGAVRLFAEGSYTLPASHHAALAEWRRNADQIALFVESEVRVLRESEPQAWGVYAADLYAAYQRWCASNGHRPMASNKFGGRMRELGHESKKTSTGWRYHLAFLSAAERRGQVTDSDPRVTDHASPESREVACA